MQQIGVIVVAAGQGSRMGGPLPKPYIMLGDKPLLAQTLSAFDRAGWFTDKVLVVGEDRLDFVKNEFPSWKVVSGGESRQDSVRKGLEALSSSSEFVLIHDGVRPFISQSLLQSLVETVRQGEHCIAALPAKETLKNVKGAYVQTTLPRETVWMAQTPQAFRVESLRKAYQKIEGTNFVATDEASLIEHLGEAVQVVLGDPRNIKITTPEDFQLAQVLWAQWKERL